MQSFRPALLALPLLALCGCGSAPEVTADPAHVAQAMAQSEAAANAATNGTLLSNVAMDPDAKAQKREVRNETYRFVYSYPAPAAAIIPLRDWLDQDAKGLEASVRSDSSGDRATARAKGFAFHAHEATTEWKTVAETQRFLSLSADTYIFTGGAHGSPGFRAILWDKREGKRMLPTDLFASPEAIQAAIGPAFCAALDTARAKRRGAPVIRTGDTTFTGCPEVKEATLILGSTDRESIDRIGLLVGPYVAGPYAEGTYDVTIPVTAAILQAVKLPYRGAFVVR